MLKRIILISFILFTFLIQIYCQRKEKSVEHKEEISKSKEFSFNSIQNRGFYSSGLGHALDLVFNESGIYEFTYGSEGIYWYNKGKYTVENEKVILNAIVCKRRMDDKNSLNCSSTFGNGYCQLDKPKFNLFYSKVLACYSKNNHSPFGGNGNNRTEFRLSEFIIPPDETIILNGISAIRMSDESALTTSDVKFREKPDVSAKNFTYLQDIYAPGLSYIPKNTKLTVHARSFEKNKVKNWEDYWYYISTQNSFSGWVYGEFIMINKE